MSKAEIRDFAASEAARADLIVVALSAAEPSCELREWVSEWEKKRQLSTGLLAVIPAGEGVAHALENYLYEAAITANMDFLCRKRRRF